MDEWPTMEVFSWSAELPSPLTYDRDEATVVEAARQLVIYLSERQDANVLVHSMGVRVYLTAADELSRRGKVAWLTRVVIAAADMEEKLFVQALWASKGLAKEVLVYGNREDGRLALSENMHSGRTRAGQASPWLCNQALPPEVTSYDVTGVTGADTELGHGAYWGAPAVVTHYTSAISHAERRKHRLASGCHRLASCCDSSVR